MKLVDHARPPPGPHRAAQLIGLAGREASRHHGQPHGLLLEERHTERLFQHRANGVAGKRHRLRARPTPQVGMHHVALNRPGPYDRHLDDEVVETGRPEPGQHAHLCPALDLKHSHGVGLRDHLVHSWVFRRHGSQRELRPARSLHQIKRPADRGQHAQREAVDLEDAQFVEVVFIPLDDRAARHRSRLNRHEVAEIASRYHHASDMLPEMAGKTDELAHERREPRAGVVGRIKAGLGQPLRQLLHAVTRVENVSDFLHPVEREPKDLRHIAHGRSQPVGDHLGRQRRPVPPVGFIDILDHLLAAVVLEVDVDVGRLAAFAADEPLEEHVQASRIDRRDPQAVADSRVGCRPPSLAKDAPPPGKSHDVKHREKVGLVTEFGHERKFVLDERPHLVWNAVWVPLCSPPPRQVCKILRRRAALWHARIGIFVPQFSQ